MSKYKKAKSGNRKVIRLCPACGNEQPYKPKRYEKPTKFCKYCRTTFSEYLYEKC